MNKCFDIEKGITVIETTQHAIDEILNKLNHMLNIAQICSKQPITQTERNQYINQMETLKADIDIISETIAYNEIDSLNNTLQSIDELLTIITTKNNSTFLS